MTDEAPRVLDLFSGIGGFSLGLERAGMRTVAFCEIEPYCRAVLKKHWPDVPCYDDVRTLTAERLAADGIAVDVICGGFPCQDISVAGKGAGLAGERSGLWSEYARLIGELRPRYVVVENVSALRSRGLDRVLGDLAALGYDAEWHCIPASAVGAPHQRDRIWIVAYAARVQSGRKEQRAERKRAGAGSQPLPLANADRPREPQSQGGIDELRRRSSDGSAGGCMADTASDGRLARWPSNAAQGPGGRQLGRGSVSANLCDTYGSRLAIGQSIGSDHGEERAPFIQTDWWLVEPDVGRVAHGVPSRVDRLRSLGNAVVPQIVEAIGKAILKAEANERP